MTDVPDAGLLEQFARNGSEDAFAALVRRHIALVHSVALRHTANPQHAQDITQAVFIILARKAGTLGRQTVLPGWLYHTARLTAANLQRAEVRRIRREQEAFMQSHLEEIPMDVHWRKLSPQLDEAMAGLGPGERDALVLRYFQNRSMAEVAQFLGLGENTAQKRVSRALEKLRKFFGKRGLSSTTGILAEMISANSIQMAPATLAQSVTGVALTQGATASLSTLTLSKGVLKIMAWTKAKTAIVSGVAVLFVAGTATLTLKEIQAHRAYPWQSGGREGLFDGSLLNRQPPQVRILSSKFTNFAAGGSRGKMMGTGLSAPAVVAAAYGSSAARTIFSAPLPPGRFDYIASLPANNAAALQREVQRKFGVVAKMETRKVDALVLRVKSPPATGWKRSPRADINDYSMLWRNSGRQLEFRNLPFGALAPQVEALANFPIMDQTGLTNRFDFELDCSVADLQNRNWDGLNGTLARLGLELAPTNLPLEMLVVETAK